ncbi:hypothetical protein HUT18_30475 [Streptomyces sp. NA04227]|uniref:hypothetical protein n=1 Tax=Streptomyces sp. NA04227 TaxID=2742136 RepID=UPI0015901505|nr:hypothetical protein [Streptomyces sp. NA04227]QKW10103.1 hypothetical protein HUT18_30475 [Streptomyces sp. NA04227]
MERDIAALPFVDEHTAVVAANTDEVWAELSATLDRSFSRPAMARYTRLIGAADCVASGPRPLSEGSTLPGFRVISASPGRELALRGTHRFSDYALTFRIEEMGPGQSRLRAESRASFPGLAGGCYQRLVIGSGRHVAGMRRMLASIRSHAESRAGDAGDAGDTGQSDRG